MNKLSKLTALLLALLMAFAAPMAAVAESNVITTEAEYKALAAQVLYDVLSTKESYMTYRDVQAYIEESEYSEFLESLEPAAREKLEAYIEELYWASFVTYIDVGPFMPPVYVSPETVDTESTVALMSLTRETTETENETSGTEEEDTTADLADLYTNKTVVDNGDGTYTVTLESYATGDIQVSTSTSSQPCDIILVLDISTSMKNTMGNGDNTTRIAALNTAVSAFLTSVKDDATKNSVGHRVALITFNGETRTNTYLRRVDNDTSYATLTGTTINYNDRQSGTDVPAGLSSAKTVFAATNSTQYNQTGYNDPIKETETDRQRVVILFTDGYPTESGSNHFDASFAASAINLANDLKDDYGATFYSVAVISGASPTGSTTWTLTSGNDTDTTPKAAMVNAYLHAVSSNYPSATCSTSGGYTITPGDPNPKGLKYYQTAGTTSALTSIFQQISTQIQSGGTTVKLDSQTVVKDVVTPYFTIPDGASGVTAQSFDCLGYVNGEPTWATTATATYTATVANNTVEVTGFDFTHNYVADEGRVEGDSSQSGNFYGRKLVVTFDIKPVNGFLGGNDVETNLPGSGIWNPNVENNPVEDFVNPPNPDVYIYKLEVSGGNQHIYLSNTADLHEFTMNFCDEYTIKVYEKKTEDGKEFDTTSKLVSTDTYKVNGVNNQYVTLTYTLKDANKNVIGVYTIAPGKTKGEGSWSEGAQLNPLLTADTTEYKVECTITPTVTGFYPTKSHEASDYIYVYKPQVTFQDTRHEFHTAATADGYYDANNYVKDSLKWYNAELQQYSTEATITDAETGNTVNAMLGTPPTLTFTYTLGSDTWITNNVVTGTACVPVNVTNVLIDGDNEITINASTNADSGYLTTNRTMPYTPCADCKDVHGTTTPTNVASGTSAPYEFVVHIYNVYGKLQITKTGLKDGESAIFKVYNATKNGDAYTKGTTLYTDVVLTGDGSGNAVSVTLGELYPDTSYYVEEASGWSWSYTVSPTSAGATIVANDTVTVSFSNTKNDQWLHDENGIVNNFGTGTKTDLDN